MRERYTPEYFDDRHDERKHYPRPKDDLLHWRQNAAVLRLTGYLDGLLGNDLLSERIELELRERVIEAQIAFNIPTKAERGGEPPAVAPDISDAEIRRAAEAAR